MIFKLKSRQKYIDDLMSILDIENFYTRNTNLEKAYTKYAKFCYKNNLPTYDYDLFNKAENIFIIPTGPDDFHPSNEEKEKLIKKLIIAINNNSGIKKCEAEELLKYVVLNTRIAISKYCNIDIFNNSLRGLCGLAQSISAYSLINLGLKITVNNTENLPDSVCGHAYITVFIPIYENNRIEIKQYLVDVSYRQFFSTIFCNEGRLYDGDKRFKRKKTIDPGYYVCKSEEGLIFANSLLKDGFIELTLENARMYGYGFSANSITLKTSKSDINRIISHSGNLYISSINDESNMRELDCTVDELLESNINLNLLNDLENLSSVKTNYQR